MWLLSAAILAAVFSCRSAQALQQTPISITKPESKTVLINCHVSDPDFSKIFVHWYRQRPEMAPKRIAYMSSRLFLENESDQGKFSIEKDPTKSVCTLTVSKITPQDSATYYCARWDAQQQKTTGDLHKDELCFLNPSLKYLKTCRNIPTLLSLNERACTGSQRCCEAVHMLQMRYSQCQQSWYFTLPTKRAFS